MKRIAIAGTALVVALVAAASAFAAVNTYSATWSFHGKKGSAAKPAGLGLVLNIKVTPGTAGDRPGVLSAIKGTIDGVKIDTKGFPTCAEAKIAAAQNDTSCPKKALVAKGYLKAELGSETDIKKAGAACDPALDVWNGGQGKLVFFFVDNRTHLCLGGSLKTGSVAPYPGKYKQSGKNLKIDIEIPNTVNYPLGLHGGLVGGASKIHLNWISQSMGSKHSIESVGCRGNKRPYTFAITAKLPGKPAETRHSKGSAACG